MGFGRLLGKALGELAAAPVTVAAEALEAVEVAYEQAGKALDRAVTKATGPEERT